MCGRNTINPNTTMHEWPRSPVSQGRPSMSGRNTIKSQHYGSLNGLVLLYHKVDLPCVVAIQLIPTLLCMNGLVGPLVLRVTDIEHVNSHMYTSSFVAVSSTVTTPPSQFHH